MNKGKNKEVLFHGRYRSVKPAPTRVDQIPVLTISLFDMTSAHTKVFLKIMQVLGRTNWHFLAFLAYYHNPLMRNPGEKPKQMLKIPFRSNTKYL